MALDRLRAATSAPLAMKAARLGPIVDLTAWFFARRSGVSPAVSRSAA
jgi:hypothetical protein